MKLIKTYNKETNTTEVYYSNGYEPLLLIEIYNDVIWFDVYLIRLLLD